MRSTWCVERQGRCAVAADPAPAVPPPSEAVPQAEGLSADERVRVRASLNEGGLIVAVERILANHLAAQARDHEAEVASLVRDEVEGVVAERLANQAAVHAREVECRLTEQREGIAEAIEKIRSDAWQVHLRLHPGADNRSCPRDYAEHDALYVAAAIARAYRGDS